MSSWDMLKPLLDLDNSKLRDRDSICRVIKEVGLNGEFPGDWPVELHGCLGKGLLIWKYPIQFSDYLIFLSFFKIHRYLEIGVHDGGTMLFTVEYLSRFNKIKEATGVDVILGCPLAEDARRFNPIYSAVGINSQSEVFRSFMRSYHFDLVMIDGEALSSSVCYDFESSVACGAKLIACHNICNYGFNSEQAKAWAEIKQKYGRDFYFVEFVGQYSSMQGRLNYPNFGIGLAVRNICNV